eukprot:NODE_24001_length_642_cov_3.887379.p2 GENE.NODE_24001_length_642_cov_3.887379~~NODE_24001_length_642_cov_3.887379.p2  ORF type:complete len:106 (+),score=4.18 NODE_24001_length_642_cov_3.887379:1-318(+)
MEEEGEGQGNAAPPSTSRRTYVLKFAARAGRHPSAKGQEGGDQRLWPPRALMPLPAPPVQQAWPALPPRRHARENSPQDRSFFVMLAFQEPRGAGGHVLTSHQRI